MGPGGDRIHANAELREVLADHRSVGDDGRLGCAIRIGARRSSTFDITPEMLAIITIEGVLRFLQVR